MEGKLLHFQQDLQYDSSGSDYTMETNFCNSNNVMIMSVFDDDDAPSKLI